MQSTLKKPMTVRQLRAARALLNWSAQELAGASKVSLATICRAEGADSPSSLTAATVQRALEDAGVRMRQPTQNA